MKLGPYSTETAEKIRTAFVSAELNFEISVSEDAISKKNKHSQVLADTEILSGPDNAVYFEVTEADPIVVERILKSVQLEGDLAEETGSELEEEFYCTQCDYRADTDGTCPKHNVALVAFEDLAAAERERAQQVQTSVFSTVLKIATTLAVLFLVWRARHSFGL